MSTDPNFFRVVNGFTIQRNQAPATDPGDPRFWWWEITNPAQSSLPSQLKGYWTNIADILNQIRLGRHYV